MLSVVMCEHISFHDCQESTQIFYFALSLNGVCGKYLQHYEQVLHRNREINTHQILLFALLI